MNNLTLDRAEREAVILALKDFIVLRGLMCQMRHTSQAEREMYSLQILDAESALAKFV